MIHACVCEREGVRRYDVGVDKPDDEVRLSSLLGCSLGDRAGKADWWVEKVIRRARDREIRG